MTIAVSSDYKTHARRLRDALAADGVDVSHSRALELIARQNGARDWNTLVATSRTPAGKRGPAPFMVGEPVVGTFNGNPVQGRVHALSETIKPDLWRITVAFDPPVDVVTSKLFSSPRRRIEMVVGADGRSRRLTGTETGVMAIRRS